MSNPLHELPGVLLQTLGRQGRIEELMQVFASAPACKAVEPLATDDPDKGVLVDEGLMVVCRRLDASSDVWGIDSFTLQTAASPAGEAWLGPWPAALPAARTTRSDVMKLWGEPEFEADRLAYFEVRGPLDQRWGLSCQFARGGALESVTLMRLDDWSPLPNVAALAILSAPSPMPAPVAAAPVVTCRSAGIVPKTGWYEARLPSDHPDFRYFSQVPGRLVRLHEGQRMLTLGVVPNTDEALVVWTWLREK